MTVKFPKISRVVTILILLGLGLGLPLSAGATDVTAKYMPFAQCDPDNGAWSAVSYKTATMVQVYETYEAPYAEYEPPNPDSAVLPDRDIYIKAIHNGTDICFSLRWEDQTEDLVVNDVPLFADAVALQLPFNGKDIWGPDFLSMCNESYHMGGTDPSPEQCGVWIAFWRADLLKPENITGVGMGTVQRTPQSPDLPNMAFVNHEAGYWTVILQRPLKPNSENMAQLERGHHYPIAYAQWDGSKKERDGRKFSTDDWEDNLIIE